MLCLWSVKGGSGCTVTAAAIGLLAAEEEPTLLVDLAGDLALALGATASEVATPGVAAPGVAGLGWGIAGWLSAPDPPPDALKRLECPITPSLSLLPLGQAGDADEPDGPVSRLSLLARLLARDRRTVVVDLGLGVAPVHEADGGRRPAWVGSALHPFLDAAASSLLVTRPCYLSLYRAAKSRRPDGIVLVDEPGRAMRPADVTNAVGVPVLAFVPWEAAVARAVDAGLLVQRVPRALRPLWSAIPVAAEAGR